MSAHELDELLFDPTAWFAIDADNQAVAGVRVPTLATGLALIGEGAVATVVGRVRPEVRVVDVDLEGPRGHAVVDRISQWCHRRGLWHLVRPSGGADGRAHVFIVPTPPPTSTGGTGGTGAAVEDLVQLVDELRRDFRASARAVDLRRSGHVRPLCAPHRRGRQTQPVGDLRTAVRQLRRHPWAASPPGPPGPGGGAAGRTPDPARARQRAAALTPRPRRTTPLPAAWETYLRTGTPPPHGGHDHSRSTDELLATAAMLRAGHTAASAWAAIATAHPAAMVKARHNRRRWTEHVWNRLVEDDHRPRAVDVGGSAAGVDEEIRRDVAAARAALTRAAWSVAPRRRRALLLVGHHLLDRIERTGQRRIPAPERDLVLDTGLSDRKTIRTALRALTTAGAAAIGVLHTDAWDPLHKRDTSSYEFELTADEGVRQIPPPGFHTPYPAPGPTPYAVPVGLWSQLPGSGHALWRALQASSKPVTPTEAAQLAALTDGPHSSPTASQRRSIDAGLVALARAGLAVTTAEGRWHATAPARTTITTTASATAHVDGQSARELRERAARRHQELAVTVAAERAQYRAAGVDTWSLQRARAHKAQLAKERAWWTDLDPTIRAERHARWRDAFNQLSVLEQEDLKDHLARRRRLAGVDEAARHRAWVASLPRSEYTARVIDRRRRYERLAPALQQASVAAWDRHRTRHGIDRDPTTPAIPDDDTAPEPRATAARTIPAPASAPMDRQLTLTS